MSKEFRDLEGLVGKKVKLTTDNFSVQGIFTSVEAVFIKMDECTTGSSEQLINISKISKIEVLEAS